jgi:hypothetical protein
VTRAPVVALVAALAGCDHICDGPACAAGESYCSGPPDQRLQIEWRASLATNEDDNPEIVDFVPGEVGRAIVNYTDANRLSELAVAEDSLEVVRDAFIGTGNLDTDLSAVEVHPSGQFAAIAASDYGAGVCSVDAQCIGGLCVGGLCECLPGAPRGCGCGSVIFVDLRPERFGEELARVGVGYAPDSTAFTADGRFLITADEDDSDIACKPPDRNGGSVSIVAVDPAPPTCETPPVALGDLGLLACRVRQIAVDHDRFSEPEEVAAGADYGIVAIQETDEIAVVPLWELPVVRMLYIPLSDEVASLEILGPDGLDVSPDGQLLAIGLEDADALAIMDLSTMSVVDVRDIGDDVPPEYNRDLTGGGGRAFEPEQVAWVESQGARFVVVTLQEANALIAYKVGPDGSMEFDSIQPVGIGFRDQLGGTGPGMIRPEGLAVQALSDGGNLMVTANEREGSLTVLRAGCPR